ncbi:hypothetical protein OAO21_03070 [Alphaproteobacteria bacterium]|nr:hypothetical protein [Alphaproteobacteria bacterium]
MKKNFRFFDNRQKYLLFVTTTNEKNRIADNIHPHIKKIKPTKPALKIFDAGMGDGSLLMNVMRQSHQQHPHVPLLVSTKEISMEDVRLGLEKLPDRFIEHKNTVFVISNLHYAEAANLQSNNKTKQKKINWKHLKLKGNSSIDFSNQLRTLNPFLEKNWQIERALKTGNPTYKTPSVLVIYRGDQEFVLNDIIPTKVKHTNKFDLIIASQPYRSRISAEKKAKYVINPMIKALAPKGKLIIVHAAGKDSANQIIKKIWPKENPYPALANEITKYLKLNLPKEELTNLKFLSKKIIRCNLRALPNEIQGGIATSVIFSAWNVAIYVNQIDDFKVLDAEKSQKYQKVVANIVNKNNGLYFNNEIFVIQKKD